MTGIPAEFNTFFAISFETLNVFSFVLGAIFGLSTGWFKYRTWWVIVAYFAIVAFFYANSEGVEDYMKAQMNSPKINAQTFDRKKLNAPYQEPKVN